MISQNKCRPEWHNLTPKQECLARMRRTGRPETPGGLPKTVDNTAAVALAADRRLIILNAIKAGYKTRGTLRRLTHAASWVDATLESLVVAKVLVARHGKNSVTYETLL